MLRLSFASIVAFIAIFGLVVWDAQIRAQEASVLVEKQTDAEAAVKGPVLPPPANPAVEATTEQPKGAATKRPFMRPAAPKLRAPGRGELTAAQEPMPAPAQSDRPAPPPEIVVRPAPPIVYDTDGDARRMYRSGQVELVMQTQDPADGCIYEIPLCIPACCTGQPIVSGGRGIFGRGVVEYCWPCGFRAVVKFRHVLGDVRVDYEGD